MIAGKQRYHDLGIIPGNFFPKTKVIKTLVLTSVVLLCFTIISINTLGQTWYNTSWGFRKSHLITGSAGAGTNYQIRIVAHKATGTDGAADVYLGSNVRDDFGDVRFTAADGTTLLSYWIETGSVTSGSQAAFWVQVAANLNTNQNIYIYYGNSSAISTSDGTGTFLLFDDFTGATLDGTKWTKRNGGTLSFSGGLMTVTTINSDPSKIIATGGGITADNNAIVARFEVTAGTNTDERAGLGVRTANATSPVGYNYIFHNFSSLNNIDFLNDQVSYGSPVNFSWSKNTFYTMEAFTNSTNIYGRVNYGSWNSQSISSLGTPTRGTNFLALNIGSFTGATTVWDWAFIRKAITTEPANSTWGAEQTAPPAITGFSPTSACQGSTGIVISGMNFTGATSVTFNGVSASYTVDNATQITATVPYTATTGAIIVMTPGGTGTGSSFTVKAIPVATASNPTNVTCNSANDGTITVTGSGGSGGYTFSVDGTSFLAPTGTNMRLFQNLHPNTPYHLTGNGQQWMYIKIKN